MAHDDYSGGLSMRVKGVRDLTQARQNYASCLTLQVRSDAMDQALTDRLAQILTGARGGTCPVSMEYLQPRNRARFALGDSWRVAPSDELLEVLREQLGHERVVLEY